MTEFCLEGKMYTPNYPLDYVAEIMRYYPPQLCYIIIYVDSMGEIGEHLSVSRSDKETVYEEWSRRIENSVGGIMLDMIPLMEEC